MVSKEVARIFVLVINYLFLVGSLLGLLRVMCTAYNRNAYMQDNSTSIQCVIHLLWCLMTSAGCYGAHKRNTCMLTTNGILYIILSFIGFILGIFMLVTFPPDMKVVSLIVFALVAVEMAGGILAIYLSECIKRSAKEQFPTIEICTKE